jgi:SAM-dependent methyltransferase
MRRFWDRRAREDPFYFVDNRLEYRRPEEQLFWAAGEADLDALLSRAGVRLEPPDSVVEIGCGIGRLTRVIAERAREVRALDVSPEMLALARRHNAGLANVHWLLGDGSSLAGIADSSASACISHVTLQHIPDPEISLGYVREMGRVLRAGGWAVFQFSNDPGMHRRRRAHGGIRLALAAAARRGPRGQSHPAWLGSSLDLADVEHAAEQAGMRLERVAGEGTVFCVALARRW